MSLTLPVILPLFAAIGLIVMERGVRFWLALVVLGVGAALADLMFDLSGWGPQLHTVGGWGAPLGIDLYADGLTLFMLFATWLVGSLVSFYALSYFSGRERRFFWPLWFFLWASLNALYLSADLFNIYVTLELVGIAAVALTALGGERAALQAALRYLLAGLVASLFYLFGVALLYSGYGRLDLFGLGGLIGAAPFVWLALALMLVALLLKTALFPLHFWLPPAHSNAAAPVSALLSALVVKAGFYLIVRLWFDLFAPLLTLPLANLLAALGAAAVLWGSLQALRAARLKLLIAYSTVAQLGYLFLLPPLAFAATGVLAWNGMLYFILAHACAKGALFLCAGTVLKAYGHDRLAELGGLGKALPLTLASCALAGVSLIGLPPSGGFIAKWSLLVAAAEAGQWWWVGLLLCGSLLAAAYLFRLLSPAMANVEDTTGFRERDHGLLVWPAFALALCAVLLGLVAPLFFELAAIGAPGFGGSG